MSIVEGGINAINRVLNGTNTAEKRSLLFCLDKHLDPYYGYDLPYFEDIIILLQKQLFLTDIREIKEDILQLLRDYGKTLDYLAEKLEELELEPELLEDALYALGYTYNLKYIPILSKYESHHNSNIRNAVREILTELSELNNTYDK